MDADSYIAEHGDKLTESEKRYIRTFGPPVESEKLGRTPYTPGLRVVDAPPETNWHKETF